MSGLYFIQHQATSIQDRFSRFDYIMIVESFVKKEIPKQSSYTIKGKDVNMLWTEF